MSRRTSESNKAIHAAWIKEQELVLIGKGTREWTPQQQRDILNRGKAYDDDGVAFQGQHMKSAEKYPEYQGDPDNIQFLTRSEHLEAHNGNWRNPTNWYFNPVTKEKNDFGVEKFNPCEVIQLSEPIIKADLTIENIGTKVIETLNEVETNKVTQSQLDIEYKKAPLSKSNVNVKTTKSLSNITRNTLESAVNFYNRHPVAISKIAKGVVSFVVGVVVVSEVVSNIGNFGSESSRDNHDNNLVNNIHENKFNSDISDNVSSIERSSSEKHMVSPHKQRYHTNEGLKWIDKSQYPRGGKKNE